MSRLRVAIRVKPAILLPFIVLLANVSLTASHFFNPRIWGNSFGVPGKNHTFDYVIVGGGTAGSTIAARLAEDPRGFSVALIEAGSFYEFENGNLTEVPGYNGWSTHVDSPSRSLVEWDFETTPQIGYNGRTMHYSQGRTLGGTSAINSLGYHRPTVGSLQMWADAVGDQDWSWENVYPYYKKSCNFSPPNMTNINKEIDISYDADAFNKDGGPLQLSYGEFRGEYTTPITKGLQKLGFKSIPGLNSGVLLGYGALTATIDPQTHIRSSSESSFLQSAMAQTSLKIYPSTLAKKILFNQNKRATGVLVAGQGQDDYEFVLSAAKEVIISAGVFRSPQLLMVSGIGPPETLRRHEIPLIAPLEGVGQNFWDQPYYRLSYQVNVTTLTQLENPQYYGSATEMYLTNGTGPLTGTVGGEVIGWEKLPDPYRSRLSNLTLKHLATFPEDFPELELLPFNIGPHPDSIESSASNNWITLAVGVLTPKSRGYVTIRSSDTKDQPIVNPNFLSEIEDEELAVQGILRVREWAAATGIVINEDNPGPLVKSEDDIRRWLKDAGALVSMVHQLELTRIGAMGKPGEAGTVLDSKARVQGVTGLRVVDSSSLPLLVPGHPMATVYMIAEKVADIILRSEPFSQITKPKPEHSEL